LVPAPSDLRARGEGARIRPRGDPGRRRRRYADTPEARRALYVAATRASAQLCLPRQDSVAPVAVIPLLLPIGAIRFRWRLRPTPPGPRDLLRQHLHGLADLLLVCVAVQKKRKRAAVSSTAG